MTRGTGKRARLRAPLSELENEVMKAVWDTGPSSVEAVHRIVSVNRDLKETTIRTLLRRLESKGYLRHKTDGRAYIYSAAEQPRNLAARAVRHIVDRFCQGSFEELVSGMVDARMLSPEEMGRIEELMRKQRKDGR